MYDAIIVGARCGGSATAMLLARQGYKVLLLDKATFPSDTLSSHQLQIPGGAFLKRHGLLDKLVAEGCPPAENITFDIGTAIVRGKFPGLDGVQAVYSPRRHVLDPILLEAAQEAGAEVRTGFTVRELASDGTRVTGIKGHTANGATLSEQARIVIGADGMRSLVARTVQAPTYHQRPSLSCSYYTYWEGVPTIGGELYGREGCNIGMWPTNDGLVITFLSVPHKDFATFHTDVERSFMHTIERVPELAERLRAGKRVDRFYGTGDLPNFFRKPYGPGWALVGDAGYHKDPVSGQGMSDAFHSAELLASALHMGWSGQQSLDDPLAAYEQQRNAGAMPMYELTCQIASYAPPTLEQQLLFASLANNSAQANRFFGVLTGTVSPTAFFSPGNLFRILGAAGMARITLQKMGQRLHPARQAFSQPGT